MEEVCYWGVNFEGSKFHTRPSLPTVRGSGCQCLVTAHVPCLPTCLHAVMLPAMAVMYSPSEIINKLPIKCFLLKVALVMFFFFNHSNRDSHYIRLFKMGLRNIVRLTVYFLKI